MRSAPLYLLAPAAAVEICTIWTPEGQSDHSVRAAPLHFVTGTVP